MIILKFQDSKLPNKNPRTILASLNLTRIQNQSKTTSQIWKEISQNFGGPWVQNIQNTCLLVDSRPLFANEKDEQNVGNKHLALVDWLMDKFVYKWTQTGNPKKMSYILSSLSVPALIDHPLTKKNECWIYK